MYRSDITNPLYLVLNFQEFRIW